MATVYSVLDCWSKYETLIESSPLVTVAGWVKTARDQKKRVFVAITDGSHQGHVQVLINADAVANVDECRKLTTGSSLAVTGTLVKSPAAGQPFELIATEVKIYQICDGSYPFQKVASLTIEFMRQFPHLRHRTSTMRAVFVIKSQIMKSIHDFFMDNQFCQVDLPVITTNACEGGCAPLQITSLTTTGKKSDIPTKMTPPIPSVISFDGKILEKKILPTDDIDFSKDFFGNAVYLTVSNQLHLETFAHGLAMYTLSLQRLEANHHNPRNIWLTSTC